MKITDFGYDGEGVGHIDGKVCFVPYTLVNEEVEVEIVKQTSSFIKGRVNKILKPSQFREEAPCPYFGKCGGCDFQHINYEREIELKKQIVQRHFNKLGYEGEIRVVYSSEEYGYRNKIRLFCNYEGLGLKQAESDKIIKVQKCLLIDDEMNTVLDAVQTFIQSKKLQKQILNVIIRKQGEVFVLFMFKSKVDIDFMGLSLILGNNCHIYYSTGSHSIIPALVYKKPTMVEFGLEYEFRLEAFHQVNNNICTQLYEEVSTAVAGEIVLNAYSGAGVLSGLLARKAEKVYGVELGHAEHESAEELRMKNNINNLINLQGYCEKVIPSLDIKFDSIVLDPPRSGCDKAVSIAINNSHASRVVYVSCNPASLVRDLALLTNYKIKEVKMFDMFPRTANCEILTILEKN